MSNLSVFIFESQEVRFVGTAEKPEWVAADVCACLELSDTSKSLETLELDEKGTKNVRTPGGEQEMLTVTEPGLYRLIFKSRKPVAKRFQRWVFHEVLPSLRRTGKYEMPQSTQAQNTRLSLDELLNFGQKVLAGTRLSPELQTITVVRGIQALYPEIAPMAQELVGAIGETVATSSRHVSPTVIGEIYAQRNGLPKPVKAHVVIEGGRRQRAGGRRTSQEGILTPPDLSLLKRSSVGVLNPCSLRSQQELGSCFLLPPAS